MKTVKAAGWFVVIQRNNGSEFLASSGSDIAFFYMRRHAAQFAKELRAHKLNARPRRGKMTIYYEPRRSKA